MGLSLYRVVIAILMLEALAFAQANPVAETLFRDGKQLVKIGKVSEACTAFEGSERLEHNVSTVLSLADCREREGKYATAWGLFLQADSETRTDPAKAAINEIAKKRATAIEGKLSYLTISVADESRIPELVITRDGKVVDPAEWNRAIPVDDGTHVVAGKAPGHEAWSTTVTVTTLDKKSVEVPKFKVLVELAPTQEPATVAPPPPAPSLLTTRRKIALGVGGGALVITGVAIVLGASANGLRDDALARCPAASCTENDARAAQDLNDRGRDRAMFANIGFGVAGAAAITAAVLWFTGAPESPTTSVAIRPLANGVALQGAF